MWGAIPGVREVPHPESRIHPGGEACSWEGCDGCDESSAPDSPAPVPVGGSRMARGLLQGARGVGPGFLGKSPPSAGMGLSGCPVPARGCGLDPRSPRDPGIAGRPDGNPAFDRGCPEGLSPWQQEGARQSPTLGCCWVRCLRSPLRSPPPAPMGPPEVVGFRTKRRAMTPCSGILGQEIRSLRDLAR